MAAGIVKRHSKDCRSHYGRGCSCKAGYEAWVYSPRDGRKLRRTFSNFAEALLAGGRETPDRPRELAGTQPADVARSRRRLAHLR